jgi:hypothetical protein
MSRILRLMECECFSFSFYLEMEMWAIGLMGV